MGHTATRTCLMLLWTLLIQRWKKLVLGIWTLLCLKLVGLQQVVWQLPLIMKRPTTPIWLHISKLVLQRDLVSPLRLTCLICLMKIRRIQSMRNIGVSFCQTSSRSSI
uniref:Uncharacterized protein n=1 Tax=Cacopsylla melanoneura TaxID=428564 RepID=A0A8D8RYK3_9HEMI